MPHVKKRYAIGKLKKKLSFARVVAIQGPRQCGKSVLATRLLGEALPRPVVVRFDDLRVRRFAQENPDLFLLENRDARPLIIDEAQKVPEIFDAIKLRVDEDVSPGRYLILGSTEFSTLFRVRESLTGRLSRLCLHPLCLAESHQLPQKKSDLAGGFLSLKPRLTLTDVLKGFEQGGMPGIFTVRSEEERDALFEDWVQLTCTRDVLQIPRLRINPDMARAVLESIATAKAPELAEISKAVGATPKVVEKILKALKELFVIEALRPHATSTGKERYYLCDAGIARFLGADRQRVLETWILQEFLVKKDLLPLPSKVRLTHYRNPKGSRIPFIIEDVVHGATYAVRPLYAEKADLRDIKILESFCKRVGGKTESFLLLADPAIRSLGGAKVMSWTSVV